MAVRGRTTAQDLDLVLRGETFASHHLAELLMRSLSPIVTQAQGLTHVSYEAQWPPRN